MEHKSARWYRDVDGTLYLQWKDKQVVNMMSTIHKADKSDFVLRKNKDKEGVWRDIEIDRPEVVAEYNKYMGGSSCKMFCFGNCTYCMKANLSLSS